VVVAPGCSISNGKKHRNKTITAFGAEYRRA